MAVVMVVVVALVVVVVVVVVVVNSLIVDCDNINAMCITMQKKYHTCRNIVGLK